MSKQNDGKAYEAMVLTIYRALCRDESFSDVQHNVKLQSPDGERQIDVLVTHEHANVKYMTVIKCKDYSGKLNVTVVDAFASKLVDVKASKGILVSRNGFSKTAYQKAKRLGIELCIIDYAEKLLKQLITELPVVLAVIQSIHLNSQLFFGNKSERPIPIYQHSLSTINDRPLRELMFEELKTGKIPIPSKSCEMLWSPTNLKPPFYIRDGNGDLLEIEWFRITLKIEIEFYFGKANDFPDFITHIQHDDDKVRVFCPPAFRLGFSSNLTRYNNKSDIPIQMSEGIPCLIMPEITDIDVVEGKSKLRIFRSKDGILPPPAL